MAFIGQARNIAVPAYLWAADVLVMPYTSRTPTVRYVSPLKMSESLAAGRPIVATDFPAVREVNGGETAVLVKPDSAEILRETMAWVLENDVEGKSIGERVRAAVFPYVWDSRASAVLKIVLASGLQAGQPPQRRSSMSADCKGRGG